MLGIDDVRVNALCSVLGTKQLDPIHVLHHVDDGSTAIELGGDRLCFLPGETKTHVADCEEPILALCIGPEPLWDIACLDDGSIVGNALKLSELRRCKGRQSWGSVRGGLCVSQEGDAVTDLLEEGHRGVLIRVLSEECGERLEDLLQVVLLICVVRGNCSSRSCSKF